MFGLKPIRAEADKYFSLLQGHLTQEQLADGYICPIEEKSQMSVGWFLLSSKRE